MNKISVRQLCLFLSCLVPCGKLLSAPAVLAREAGGDLLISALINFIFQGIIIFLLLWLSERTSLTFFDMLKASFGRAAAKVVYFFFALYFLFYSLFPLLEQKAFVQSELYDSLPSLLVFLPFFFFSLFACTKNITAIGRSADIALPLFVIGVGGILFMSFSSADFSAILPIGDATFPKILGASVHTQNWFSDSAFVLLFLGRFPAGRKTTIKATLAYAVGAAVVLAVLLVFYGIFQSVAPRQSYAISRLGRYYSALSVIGRVDILLCYVYMIALLFYSAVPLQLSCECLARVFGERRIIYSIIINAAALCFIVAFGRFATVVYRVIDVYLFPVFTLFAYAAPAAALFLKKKGGVNENGKAQ